MRLVRLLVLAVAVVMAGATPAFGIRFAVKGDWGSGLPAQAVVSKRMCVDYDRARFAFILTTGDNFYPSGTATPQTFGRPERCLLERGLRYRAVWGNHDVPGPSTRSVLKAPARWYTFLAGPARIVALDANQPANEGQLKFLKTVLAAEQVRPVIVAYHQGTRTAGLHEPRSEQLRLWEPIFAKYKVKLVLQGHNHLYERIATKGITYITTGGGGHNLYPCLRKPTGLIKCVPEHHFLLVEVTPTKLAVRAIGTDGKLIDRIRLTLTPPDPVTVPAAPAP